MGIFTMILQGVRSNVIRWFNVKISASRFRGDDDNFSFKILLGWKIEKNLVSKKALAAMTGEIHTTLEHSRIDEHS